MAGTGGDPIVPSPDDPAPLPDDPALGKRLKETRGNLQKSIDAYAVILVLLASITYIGFLQPPGSFDEGGLIGTSSRLRSFVYCNSFSFFFSITDLLLCVSGKPDLETADRKSNKQLARSVVYSLMKLLGVNLLFVVSLTCCMGAYISAGTVVQNLNIADQETILISSIIGSSLYTVFILLLLFLCTFPTLRFFSTGSECSKAASNGSQNGNGSNGSQNGNGSNGSQNQNGSNGAPNSNGSSGAQSQCCPWKNPCEILKKYLENLENKLLESKSCEGGNLPGPTATSTANPPAEDPETGP